MNKQYKELLREILDEGYEYTDIKRNVRCKQIDHKTLDIDFQKGFPAINLKKLYWKGVVAELLWFLRGDTNIKYLVDNGVNIWNKDALNYCNRLSNYEYDMNTFLQKVKNEESIDGYNKFGDLGRIYGAQWRNWDGPQRALEGLLGIDQISNLIKNLKENPMSRIHIVTAWNPAELYDVALPPCHWSFEIIVKPISEIHIKKRKGGCSKGIQYGFTLKWHQRSVDTFLGLPFNIASYALLAHIIGKLTNMVPMRLIGDLSNVHLYENSWKASRELIKRDPTKYDLPKLKDFGGFKLDMHNNFDQWVNSKKISDFQLENYKSYPNIKVEMLSPNV